MMAVLQIVRKTALKLLGGILIFTRRPECPVVPAWAALGLVKGSVPETEPGSVMDSDAEREKGSAKVRVSVKAQAPEVPEPERELALARVSVSEWGPEPVWPEAGRRSRLRNWVLKSQRRTDLAD
jgi:hypothetical protein